MLVCSDNDEHNLHPYQLHSWLSRIKRYLGPPVGETVDCEREARNPLRKDSVTVGHVPRTISCIFTLFLRCGGVIVSTITGPRKHSDDLPQGGLELPCTY